MRAAIADDSLIVRTGVATLLRECGFSVDTEARDGVELLASIERDVPDVVLLDIRMPPTFTDEGLTTAARLRERAPSIGILLLSTYTEAEYAAQLLRIGRSGVGYLLKDKIDDVRRLTDAIHRVAEGESVVDPDVVAQLLARESARTQLDKLSPRQQDVLKLLAEGKSNVGIAHELYIEPSTVERHITSLFLELGLPTEPDVNRRVLAVLLWLQAAGRSAC
jgi:DNA-binding NarL/FixJ family response regulator